jgi:hypothetical protein
MTLLQSTQKGRHTSFSYSNVIIWWYRTSMKEINQRFKLIYNLQMAHMHLETSQTLCFLLLTNATPRLKWSPSWYTPLQSKKVYNCIDKCFTEHEVVHICYIGPIYVCCFNFYYRVYVNYMQQYTQFYLFLTTKFYVFLIICKLNLSNDMESLRHLLWCWVVPLTKFGCLLYPQYYNRI